MPKTLLAALFFIVTTSISSLGARASDDFDEQMRYSERLFNEGIKNRDPDKVLRAAQIRENLMHAQTESRTSNTNQHQNHMSNQVEQSGFMTSTDMLKAGKIFGDDWLTLLKRFRRVVIFHRTGDETVRHWQMERDSEADFGLTLSSSQQINISVESVGSRSLYLVIVESESGRTLCKNDKPATYFECEITVTKAETLNLKITNKGPLVSGMRMLIS